MKKIFERSTACILAITLLLSNATVLAYDNDVIIEEVVSNDIEVIDEEIFNIDFNDEFEEEINENFEEETVISDFEEEVVIEESVALISTGISVADGVYDLTYSTSNTVMVINNIILGVKTAVATVENGVATYIVDISGLGSSGVESAKIVGGENAKLNHTDEEFATSMEFASNFEIVDMEIVVSGSYFGGTYYADIIFDWENAIDITPEEPAKTIDVADGVYELTYSTTSTDMPVSSFVLAPKTAIATVENGVATYIIDNNGYMSTGAQSAKIIGGNSVITYYTDGISYVTSMEFASNLQTVNLEIITTGLQAGTYEADVIFDWGNAIDITPEEQVKEIDVADGVYEVPLILDNGLNNYIKTTAKAVVVNNIATYTIYNAGETGYDAPWFTSRELYINGTKTTELRDDDDYFPYGFLLMSSLYEFDAVVEIRSNFDGNFSDRTKEGTIVFDWKNATEIKETEPESKVADGIYELPLYSAYYRYHTNGYTTESDASMSNNAVNHTAIAVVNGDKTDFYIQFKGMNILTLEGHLLYSYYYPQSVIDSGVLPSSSLNDAIQMETLTTVNDVGLYNQINDYISHLAFEYDANAPENVYIRVWVDAMEGFETQHAVLVFDWDNANKINESLISLEVSSTKHQTYYSVGDEINLSDLQIIATDTDRKTETLNVTSDMISGFDSSEEGIIRVTISYKGFETTYAVNIIEGDFTVPENTEKYIATDVIAYQYYKPDEFSMCNGVFSGDAEVEITGENAVLKLYVANPTPKWGGLADGVLKDLYIVHDGVKYYGEIVSGYENPDAPIRQFTQDSSFFGIEKGNELACDVITFELPAQALAGSNGTYIHLSAFVNLVMNSQQDFYLDIKWDSDQVIAKPVSIAVNSTSHITSYEVGDALNVSGLTILVTMDDGTTQTRVVSASMISGFSSAQEELSRILTITYEGLTTTYEIKILESSGEVEIGDGTYSVPIYFKKFTTVGTYSKNSENSMASEAIVGTAMATVSGDNITYTIRIKGIELSGLYGHLLNMYHYSKDDVNDGKLDDPIPTTIQAYVDDKGLEGDIESFPEIISLKYTGDINDNVYVYTYVDAMIGFNYQNAVLVFDWDNAIFDNGTSALDGYYSESGDDEYELTTTFVKDATISNGKAKATYTADEISSTINALGDNSYDTTLIFDVRYDENISTVETIIPRESIEEIIHKTRGLVIKTDKAEVHITNLSLYCLVDNIDGDFKLTIKDVNNTDITNVYNINQGRTALDFTINIGMKIAKNFKKSITVKIPYNVELGEVSRRLGVHYVQDDENSTKMHTSTYNNGYMIFETNHFSTFAITYQNFIEKFSDVKDYHWFAESIETMVEQGIFTGVTENIFSPNGEITREMFITVLYRLSGETSETDSEDWSSKAVTWAIENGISDGSNLDREISREEIAVMLHRFAENPETNGSIDKYNDSENVSSWAIDATVWANSQGLITGKTTSTLNPQENATRAEVSTMLARFLQ